MNVLITGGAGFIGQYLTRSLLKAGCSVRILDSFHPQIHGENGDLPVDLKSQVGLIRADVRDRDALLRAVAGVDTVVHLAAETGTGQSMYEIERYFSVNVQGTATLLDVLQNEPSANSVRSIILASSRAIYGEGAYHCEQHGVVYPDSRSQENMAAGILEPHCPICSASLQMLDTDETAPFKPMSMYGLTKQVQEQGVLLFANMKGINGFALRYQNVYGAGQSLKNPYTGILAVFSNLARQGQTIEIYEDGLESRDFVYVSDVVEATMSAIKYPGSFVGALNVGSGEAVSVVQVAEQVNQYFGGHSTIRVTGAFRVGDIRHNRASLQAANKVLGFVPSVSFPSGLKMFLEWAETQPLEDKRAYQNSVDELSARSLMGQVTKI
ncbi:MAG: NAD-dependent epimerase/dehydratase family protein [Desulfuromonadaceae bacterium]|nr:NAD-dependent epimerase/dehydratase family protein [Desulfuromonadaceae bacterium]